MLKFWHLIICKLYLNKIDEKKNGHVLSPVSPHFMGLRPFPFFQSMPSPPIRTSEDPPGLPRSHIGYHCGRGWEQATPGCPYFWGPCSHCDLAEDSHTGTVDHSSTSPWRPMSIRTYSAPHMGTPCSCPLTGSAEAQLAGRWAKQADVGAGKGETGRGGGTGRDSLQAEPVHFPLLPSCCVPRGKRPLLGQPQMPPGMQVPVRSGCLTRR